MVQGAGLGGEANRENFVVDVIPTCTVLNND